MSDVDEKEAGTVIPMTNEEFNNYIAMRNYEIQRYDIFSRYIEDNADIIGYGAMMHMISRLWQIKDPIGALTVGPCYLQVEKYGNYFDLLDKLEGGEEK